MKVPRRWWRRVGCGLALMGGLYAFQKPFRVYPSMEPYDNVPLPPDYRQPAEWVQARLMYPNHPEARFSRRLLHRSHRKRSRPTDPPLRLTLELDSPIP